MNKNKSRKIRHKRLRAKISGSSETPRLSVFKSNKHFYLQIIDDETQKTLASSSDLSVKEARKKTGEDMLRLIGMDLLKKAQAKKIKAVVFDRGGFPYAGNIKKIADIIREGGIKF